MENSSLRTDSLVKASSQVREKGMFLNREQDERPP